MAVRMRGPGTAGRLAAAGIVAASLLAAAGGAAGASRTSHGISVFGDLRYRAGFTHFAYVEPAAPKGGRLRLAGRDSFDSLNPFLLKGVPADGASLMFDRLMVRAMDEPDALYGLVASSVEVDAERRWIAFDLRPRARWHDGSPLTAADVAFTFDTLVKRGHPVYRLLFTGVRRAKAEGRHRIRFDLKPGASRALPAKLAALPVLSRTYHEKVPFARTSMTPPMGSGPYRLERVDPGRQVVYRRDPDYWGRDLPVNRGRFNFDRLQWDYFRDRGIAREAFFAGEYDFHEEFVSRSWARQYDKPPVRDGRIVREVLPDGRPAGVQAFFINLRRKKFADRRVRRALNLAFDFEWTNEHLFFGLYRRMESMFANSPYAATGPPGPAELALLRPFAGQVPEEVFAVPYRAPSTARGRLRDNLLEAARLLREAGWTIRDHTTRVNRRGVSLEVEFLVASPSFTRILGPYTRNLLRLGIGATIRVADAANFKNRRDRFDFDVAVQKFPQFLTPGAEQREYFGSAAASVPGSKNISGLESPAVDALIERVVAARSRDEAIVAARALDRVLMWTDFAIPHWYKGRHHVAYWNRYARPATKPRYDLGVLDTWWFDPSKHRLIEAGETPPGPDR